MRENRRKEGTKDTMSRKLGVVLIIMVLAFIFSLTALNSIWHHELDHTDVYVFQYVGRVIQSGGMPYRDTFDHKGPLLYIVNALGLMINPDYGLWILEYIGLCISFFFLYRSASLFTSDSGSLFTNVSGSLLTLLVVSGAMFKYYAGGKFQEEYALPFICVSLFIYLDYFLNRKITKTRLIICGLSFGAICLLRANMSGLWIVMSIGVLVICVVEKRNVIHFLLFFLIGAALIIIPIMVWLGVNGAFGDFISDYIDFNRLYTSSTEEAVSWINKAQAFLFLIREPVVWLSFAVAIYYVIRERTAFSIMYLAYFIINIALLSISGRAYWHYGLVMAPSLVVPVARVLRMGKGIATGVILSVIFICFSWIPAFIHSIEVFQTRNEPFSGGRYRKVVDLVNDNTRPDDKIVVCGNADSIYILSNRPAATKYSFQNVVCEIDEERKSEFYREVRENDPPMIIVADNYFDNQITAQDGFVDNYLKLARVDKAEMTVFKRVFDRIDNYDITLSANDEVRHGTVVPLKLKAGKRYKLNVKGATVLEGDPSCISARLYDYSNGTVIKNKSFYAPYNDMDWFFTTPENDEDYAIVLYAGEVKHTDGIGVRFEGISAGEADS